MPGSIQVSVLDFQELPSSSNFVKISLGKVEYKSGVKETFSFPLTNLHDNLIITIHDADGNPVSQSGVQTMSIIEKGIWDDIFPLQGGGFVHMNLKFSLSEEERNRIRSMRESVMKKKKDEIIKSRLRNTETGTTSSFRTSSLRRHEVSDVLSSTSSQDFRKNHAKSDAVEARASRIRKVTFKIAHDEIKEEIFQSGTSPNATGKMVEASSSPSGTERVDQNAFVDDFVTQSPSSDLSKKNKQHLVEEIPSYVKKTSEESTSTLLQENEASTSNRSEARLHKADVPERLEEGFIDDMKTQSPLFDTVKKSKQVVEEIPGYVKKTSEKSMPPTSKPITEVNSAHKSEIQVQGIEVNSVKNKERLQEGGHEKLANSKPLHNLAEKLDKLYLEEKIRSFVKKTSKESSMSTLLLPENKVSSLKSKPAPVEKTPSNIRQMISAFESNISQDRGSPSKPKSYRVGTVHLFKDHASQERLKNSEGSSSLRLRNSFSMNDLQKAPLNVIKSTQSKETDSLVKEPDSPDHKGTCTDKHVETSLDKDSHEEHKTFGLLKDKIATEETLQDTMKGIVHLGTDGITKQGEDISHMPGNSSPKSSDEEASTGPFKQVIKIALVVGFAVLVILFRQREHGKSKRKESMAPLKTRVYMNKRGSIEEQIRKIDIRRLS